MHYTTKILLASALLVAVSSSSYADGNNNPPPAGNVILDLNGKTVPSGTAQNYTASFTASLSSTSISFAFREDPWFLQLSQVSVASTLNPSVNLLVNGDFSQGTYSAPNNNSVPLGWTFQNTFGATFQGEVQTGCDYVRPDLFGFILSSR